MMRRGSVLIPVAIGLFLGLWRAQPVFRGTAKEARQSGKPDGRELRAAQRTDYSQVAGFIARRTFEKMTDSQRQVFSRLCEARGIGSSGPAPGIFCFSPETDESVVDAFQAILHIGDDSGGAGVPRFQQTSRWSSTATNAGPLSQGDPTVLTYSFPPDGTVIPDIGIGFPAGVNALNARLAVLYGTTAAGQAFYDQVFARWSQLCGVVYVRENNDDGEDMHVTPGQLGVRGDLRMGGMSLDGNSGVLAYNNFPQDGDMVIDTADSYYTVTTGNSLRLRNILAHEHGHGMGQLHVCPRLETKLMEPFISVMYDGPQHDDILNAQRHYGDRFEHNDTAGTATSLGALSDGATVVNDLSADDNSDVDFYSFTITPPKSLSATVQPIGQTYSQGPQTSQCNTGTNFNSLTVNDLGIDIRRSDGVTILASANVNPAGQADTAVSNLTTSETYYVRVFAGTTNNVQAYQLSLTVGAPASVPPTISFPSGTPSLIPPGVPAPFAVNIDPQLDTLVPGSAVLYYRYDGGAFISSPLTSNGGTSYTANLPAPRCADTPQFYVEVQGVTNGFVRNPAGGASTPLSAEVGVDVTMLALNFETAPGWTVANGGGLTDGPWDRGVPVNCNRGDPPTDFDGSGQCWLTDNSAAASCNSDVDNGTTTLTSPVFDLTGMSDPRLVYARWYSNVAGDNPQADTFVVEYSSNGGSSWSILETVGPMTSSPNPEVTGGWFLKSFDIGSIAPLNNQFRVRFSAADLASQSVVEAGLDALSIIDRTCVDVPVPCTSCDVNDDAYVNGVDVQAFISALLLGGTAQEICAADLEAIPDGGVDFDDVAPFVQCLLSGG